MVVKKVLNLYAGIGGNRELWKDCEVTAVEIDEDIATFYGERFPQDEVIVGDAHQFLLDNYEDFDFIWSSPPCPSHSRARFWNEKAKKIYPDMSLYQEILFLQHHFDGGFIVENVVPYYEPLIEGTKIGRHMFWSNFDLTVDYKSDRIKTEKGNLETFEEECGFTTKSLGHWRKRYTVLRNMVDPKLGSILFNNYDKSNKVAWL